MIKRGCSKMATHSRERLGSVALMLMTFSAVFAFPSIVNNSIQIGLATIPGYLFGSIFYFLPFILMIAEFASANSENESGVTFKIPIIFVLPTINHPLF